MCKSVEAEKTVKQQERFLQRFDKFLDALEKQSIKKEIIRLCMFGSEISGRIRILNLLKD